MGRVVGVVVAGIGVAAAMSFSAGVAAAASTPLSIAIVVGSNQRPSPAFENLRFGDDDAIQHARTFELLGTDVRLLVSPDGETRELFPEVRPAGPATLAALREAFDRAAGAVAAARTARVPTRAYVIFAGHGDVSGGRPFLQLDDGRLWREDLAEMLRNMAADESHVIIDACHSAAFVAPRGPGGERGAAPPGFSRGEQRLWPARTGFLTARSWGGQTHEWEEFQAGVFSHEVRSALAGGADVNLDGRVTYREIAAFVHRANEAIPNRRYRPQVSTSPPAGDLDASLASLPGGPMVLELDLEPAGRTFVETEKGVRLLDVHAAPGVAVQLRLPTNEGNLFVRHVPSGRELRLEPQPGKARASTFPSGTPRARPRGAAHEAFLLLFARPFDRATVATFQLAPAGLEDQEPPGESRLRRWGPWVAAGTGVAALGAAAGFALWSRRLENDGRDLDGRARPALNERIEANNERALAFGVVGAALTVAGIVWWLQRRESP